MSDYSSRPESGFVYGEGGYGFYGTPGVDLFGSNMFGMGNNFPMMNMLFEGLGVSHSMRNKIKGILPDSIFGEPKSPFGGSAPADDMFNTFDRNMVRDSIRSNVNSINDRFKAGHDGLGGAIYKVVDDFRQGTYSAMGAFENTIARQGNFHLGLKSNGTPDNLADLLGSPLMKDTASFFNTEVNSKRHSVLTMGDSAALASEYMASSPDDFKSSDKLEKAKKDFTGIKDAMANFKKVFNMDVIPALKAMSDVVGQDAIGLLKNNSETLGRKALEIQQISRLTGLGQGRVMGAIESSTTFLGQLGGTAEKPGAYTVGMLSAGSIVGVNYDGLNKQEFAGEQQTRYAGAITSDMAKIQSGAFALWNIKNKKAGESRESAWNRFDAELKKQIGGDVTKLSNWGESYGKLSGMSEYDSTAAFRQSGSDEAMDYRRLNSSATINARKQQLLENGKIAGSYIMDYIKDSSIASKFLFMTDDQRKNALMTNGKLSSSKATEVLGQWQTDVGINMGATWANTQREGMVGLGKTEVYAAAAEKRARQAVALGMTGTGIDAFMGAMDATDKKAGWSVGGALEVLTGVDKSRQGNLAEVMTGIHKNMAEGKYGGKVLDTINKTDLKEIEDSINKSASTGTPAEMKKAMEDRLALDGIKAEAVQDKDGNFSYSNAVAVSSEAEKAQMAKDLQNSRTVEGKYEGAYAKWHTRTGDKGGLIGELGNAEGNKWDKNTSRYVKGRQLAIATVFENMRNDEDEKIKAAGVKGGRELTSHGENEDVKEILRKHGKQADVQKAADDYGVGGSQAQMLQEIIDLFKSVTGEGRSRVHTKNEI